MTGLDLLLLGEPLIKELLRKTICVLREDFRPKTGTKPKTDNPDVNQPSKLLRNSSSQLYICHFQGPKKGFPAVT